MNATSDVYFQFAGVLLVVCAVALFLASFRTTAASASLQARVMTVQHIHKPTTARRRPFTIPSLLSERKRLALSRQGIPDLLDLLALCVTAGLSFDGATARAADVIPGPLGEELLLVLSDLSLGATRSEAISELARRLKLGDLRVVSAALAHADALGTPIAECLRDQARGARETRLRLLEERTQKLPVKLLMPLVLCILPALFVVIIGPAVIHIANSGLLG